MECNGDRPFQGFHGLSILPNAQNKSSFTMFVSTQSALYQDGPTPKHFVGSNVRIMVFDIQLPKTETLLQKLVAAKTPTAKYVKSYRYTTSQLTFSSLQKGARHFNALYGLLAIDENRFLVAESEDFFGYVQCVMFIMYDYLASILIYKTYH